MKTLSVKGTDILSYESPLININDAPLAVKTRSTLRDKDYPIYLIFTQKALPYGKSGLCFPLPSLFLDWWIKNDPTRRIVCQDQKLNSWYWLKMANVNHTALFSYTKFGNSRCLRVGMQNFEHDKDREFYRPRKFKCVKKAH